MALSEEEQRLVPDELGPADCYARIYQWHQRRGESEVQDGRLGGSYRQRYLLLLQLLPPPLQVSDEDRDFVLGQVLGGLMEWAYHEMDEAGIKTAAYAYAALRRLYPRGPQDPVYFRSSERSLLRAATLSQIVVVPVRGQLVVCQVARLAEQIVLTPSGVELPVEPLILLPRVAPELIQAIGEFERLLNDGRASEADYQSFFERYPLFLTGLEYERVLARPVLEMGDEGRLIPDFLLQPVSRRFADIVDLKLPGQKVVVGRRHRLRFSSAVHEAVAQVREYRDFFEDSGRREAIRVKYGLTAYRPKVAVIIGRTPEEVDEAKLRDIGESLPSHTTVVTFDELLDRMKRLAVVYSL